jgi:hypothetical protein
MSSALRSHDLPLYRTVRNLACRDACAGRTKFKLPTVEDDGEDPPAGSKRYSARQFSFPVQLGVVVVGEKGGGPHFVGKNLADWRSPRAMRGGCPSTHLRNSGVHRESGGGGGKPADSGTAFAGARRRCRRRPARPSHGVARAVCVRQVVSRTRGWSTAGACRGFGYWTCSNTR